jgi:hypothetical protein
MPAIPIQVTFKGIAHSYALELQIRESVEWLRQYEPDITGCRVVIEVPHRHHQDVRLFRVRLSVSVPDGAPVMVDREQTARETAKAEDQYQDAYVLVREAFDIARRRLQDFVREQRGFVKAHSR